MPRRVRVWLGVPLRRAVADVLGVTGDPVWSKVTGGGALYPSLTTWPSATTYPQG